MSRIMIAIPTYETVCTETYAAVSDILTRSAADGHEMSLKIVKGYGVAEARNKLVDKALEHDADWIFFVDSDVVPDPSSLATLIHPAGPDLHADRAVFGFYARKSSGRQTGATSLFVPGERDYVTSYTSDEIAEFRSKGVYRIPVHGAGFGCTLVRTDIFRNEIEYPWFRWKHYPGSDRRQLGEDFYFAEKCRRAGIPLVADTRVGCGHVMRYVQEVM